MSIKKGKRGRSSKEDDKRKKFRFEFKCQRTISSIITGRNSKCFKVQRIKLEV